MLFPLEAKGGLVWPEAWSPALSALEVSLMRTDTSNKMRPVRKIKQKNNSWFLQKTPSFPGTLVSWEPPWPWPFWEASQGHNCPATPFWGWWAWSHCTGHSDGQWTPDCSWQALGHWTGWGALLKLSLEAGTWGRSGSVLSSTQGPSQVGSPGSGASWPRLWPHQHSHGYAGPHGSHAYDDHSASLVQRAHFKNLWKGRWRT